jgi:hypothetical protein
MARRFIFADCCARATSGDAAAPPISVMNVRRFMCLPQGSSRRSVAANFMLGRRWGQSGEIFSRRLPFSVRKSALATARSALPPSSGHSSRRLSLKECSEIECCYFPRGQHMSTSAAEAAIPCLLEKRRQAPGPRKRPLAGWWEPALAAAAIASNWRWYHRSTWRTIV